MSIPKSRETAPAPTTAITSNDLRWLVCPVCHGSLVLHQADQVAGNSPKIACTACARLYPIVDNLPVLLADSATLPT